MLKYGCTNVGLSQVRQLHVAAASNDRQPVRFKASSVLGLGPTIAPT
jgi:hypothetical protein